MVRTPCMRLPMSLVPPVVCDIFWNRPGGKKWQKASMWRIRSIPQLLAGQAGALDQRLEFRPHDRGMDAAVERALGKAAVGADHHVLAADEIGEAQRALGDQFGMLHYVGGMADDAGDQHLARRQFRRLPHLPFMLMAWIGR